MKFTRTFNGTPGQSSTDAGGPDQLEQDLNNIAKNLDPAQSGGGVGTENLQTGAATDAIVGDRTGNPATTTPLANTGSLTALFSWLMKAIGAITGSDWKTPPTTTLNALDADVYRKGAMDTALAAKAPINSPTFTGTVSGVSKAMVGLENVDNTADVNKTVSKAAKLATARKIGNADFDGSAGITLADIGAYSKTELQTSGQSVVNFANLINVPNFADASWKPSVASRAALPLTGNVVGDQRVVLNDGDGKQAIYTCVATTGNVDAQWAKVGDVDWMSEEATRVAQETARGTAEGVRSSNEATRVTSEGNRVTAETARGNAEGSRATAETARASAETTRLSAEMARGTAEGDRASAETTRLSNETARGNAEGSRATAEGNRATAETARGTAEGNRATAETTRGTAESARVTAEGNRISAESNRASAETARGTAESGRVTAESGRVTAESGRVTAESGRTSAEIARAARDTNMQVWGAYNASTDYVPLNKVSYLGSSYINIAACRGVLPTDTSKWLLIAQKGADGAGSGDMLKATYDTDNDGVVDAAEKLGTARNINGVPFDGTQDINIEAGLSSASAAENFQGARNINLIGGGQLTWGVVANQFAWTKAFSIYPGGGKLLVGGVALTSINIAIGNATLANAGDCMYITIPTTNGATAPVAVAQYNAITGTDKLILAIRDVDSCLELLGGGWLTYGTTVAAGGKRDNYVDATIIAAVNDFIVGSGAKTVVKKTLAETKTILGINAATATATGVVELATPAEAATGTDTTRAVTCAGLKGVADLKAPLASPALTGTPTAPTATAGTNTTQIATTAFVMAATPVGAVTETSTSTLSNKTLTSPRFGSAGFVADAIGNELIEFPATVASAVNEIVISNAATGTGPSITATGDDTNVDLRLGGKGSGAVKTTTQPTTATCLRNITISSSVPSGGTDGDVWIQY